MTPRVHVRREADGLRRTATMLLAALLAATTAGAGEGAHDLEGRILLGTGDLRLEPGVDHASMVSPYGAIGFDLHGDAALRYEYVRGFDSGGTRHHVAILAPAGAVDVPWALDWVFSGPAEVVFSGAHATTCHGLTCEALPLP